MSVSWTSSVRTAAVQRVPQLPVDVVVAQVAADRRVEEDAPHAVEHAVAHLRAVERAAVDLLDLVAGVRIAEEEREVREQVEAIRREVEERAQLARLRGVQAVLQRELVARRAPALVGIDRAEAPDEPLGDGPRGDLSRTVPIAGVAHLRERQARRQRGTERDLVEELVSIPTLRVVEGTVGVVDLGGEGRLHRQLAETRARDGEPAGACRAVPGRADQPRRDGAALEGVARDHVHGAGGREVALAREVRTLRDLHALDDLGDDEVRVGVALAVRV
jgi:hypothetical protein